MLQTVAQALADLMAICDAEYAAWNNVSVATLIPRLCYDVIVDRCASFGGCERCLIAEFSFATPNMTTLIPCQFVKVDMTPTKDAQQIVAVVLYSLLSVGLICLRLYESRNKVEWSKTELGVKNGNMDESAVGQAVLGNESDTSRASVASVALLRQATSASSVPPVPPEKVEPVKPTTFTVVRTKGARAVDAAKTAANAVGSAAGKMMDATKAAPPGGVFDLDIPASNPPYTFTP